MSSTQQLARRYYDAWTSGGGRTVAAFAGAGAGAEGGDRA
jgi:hypothetical protein